MVLQVAAAEETLKKHKSI